MRLIDADALVEKSEFFRKDSELFHRPPAEMHSYKCVTVEDIENAPTVGAAMRGEWSLAIGYDPRRAWMCSECQRMTFEPSQFCPNCGAKMDIEEGAEG